MIEIRLHLSASACLAVPMDGNHAQFGGKHRLRRDGAWRGVGFDGGHDDARPFAKLVAVRGHGAHPDLDHGSTVQAAEAELRLIRRAGRMPRSTIHMLAPLNGVIADFDGRVVRGFGHGRPHGRGQTVGIPVRAEVGVRLHHKTKRSPRHAMVTVGRGGRAALATGQCGTARDALDLLRLSDGCVVFDVVQGDGSA